MSVGKMFKSNFFFAFKVFERVHPDKPSFNQYAPFSLNNSFRGKIDSGSGRSLLLKA